MNIKIISTDLHWFAMSVHHYYSLIQIMAHEGQALCNHANWHITRPAFKYSIVLLCQVCVQYHFPYHKVMSHMCTIHTTRYPTSLANSLCIASPIWSADSVLNFERTRKDCTLNKNMKHCNNRQDNYTLLWLIYSISRPFLLNLENMLVQSTTDKLL